MSLLFEKMRQGNGTRRRKFPEKIPKNRLQCGKDYVKILERLNQGKGSMPFYRNLMREVKLMKEGIHPKYEQTTIRCACGAVIETGSTKKDIKVEICSKCHPFYTGKQKLVDTGGRVDRFNKKYGLK